MRMMKKSMVLFLCLVFTFGSLLMMSSCAKKQVQVEDTAAAPPAPPPEPKEVGPSAEDQAAAAEAERQRQAKLAEEAARKLEGEISMFESEKIYFDFDRSELKPEARTILTKKADWLRNNPKFKLRIEGHCDERGSTEYNLALGERRANAAWKFLNALGVSGDRMDVISYGEERPDDPGHGEEAWAKNRRDEFVLID
jgi:peptidoglycan-associated lipoprotein